MRGEPDVREQAWRRPRTLVVAVVALVAVALVVVWVRQSGPTVASPAPEPVGLWTSSDLPADVAEDDTRDVTLGTVFTVEAPGTVTGIQFFRVEGNRGPHDVTLATAGGRVLAEATIGRTLQPGWTTVDLDAPVPVDPSTSYVASYRAPAGRYSVEPNAFSDDSPLVRRGITAWGSRFRYAGEQTQPGWRDSSYFVGPLYLADGAPVEDGAAPPPGPDESARGEWPGPDDTGVPDGEELSPYQGPTTITEPGTVIDAKLVEDSLVIEAPDVVIERSRVEGTVLADSSDASVRIVDSEVDGGPGPAPAVGYHRVTVLRSEIVGGQHSVLCGDQCVVRDSWLHDQALPSGVEYHNNAFISNGGSGVVLEGNRLSCTPEDNGADGGCSTNLSLFGDFEPIDDVQIVGNLFEATPGGYCGSFGWNEDKRFGTASGVVVTDNVFERGETGACGEFGPVTSFAGGPGSSWSGNRWTGGAPVEPAG